jgi:DNA-directed RNA polymerase specialized sigma24 family protein
MSEARNLNGPSTEQQWFASTRWSVVLAAGHDSSAQAKENLERLCRIYWYPLYAFLRRKGYGSYEAEDLTQGFFARFLEKRYLEDVKRDRGKFRSFLLCSLEHFVANEWDKSRRLKRGGGVVLVPLETAFAEERFRSEPGTQDRPELLFDRSWAQTLLEVVLRRLREDYEQAGKGSRFVELKAFLLGEPSSDQYVAVGQRLEMKEQAIKSAVFRLRRRFRDLFREEIAHTALALTELDPQPLIVMALSPKTIFPFQVGV